MLISEVIDELGATSDFVGHAGGENFIIITQEKKAEIIKARLKERFDKEVLTHYNFMDRRQGFMQSPNVDGTISETSFMTMSIGIVLPRLQSFVDIREITELSAEARRQDASEELLSKVPRGKDWAYLHLQIKEFESFREVYPVSDTHEVKWFTVKMIREVMGELQLTDSFLGHTSKDEFVIILPQKFTKTIREKLKSRFDIEVLSHYHYIHREHGYIRTKDHKKHSLMKLTIRAVSPTDDHLANIKKIGKVDQYIFTLDD
jgi:GGDEF domain-containing protein